MDIHVASRSSTRCARALLFGIHSGARDPSLTPAISTEDNLIIRSNRVYYRKPGRRCRIPCLCRCLMDREKFSVHDVLEIGPGPRHPWRHLPAATQIRFDSGMPQLCLGVMERIIHLYCALSGMCNPIMLDSVAGFLVLGEHRILDPPLFRGYVGELQGFA